MKTSDQVKTRLAGLPTKPGVYIMRDVDGRVIYVGKAVVLRNRVRSYFQEGAQHPPKTERLVSEVADLEWIVTESELEALILECELIKRYSPRYNVRLKDDKRYPYIKITLQEDFPRVFIVRNMLRDGARYFGPFTSSQARVPEPGAAAAPLPLPHLRPRDHRQGSAALPLLPYQALRGALHRRRDRGGISRR